MLAQNLSKVGAIANNGNQQMTLFQQGEVAVFMASTGNVARLKSLGVPCEFAHPRPARRRYPLRCILQRLDESRGRLPVHGRRDLGRGAGEARAAADRDDVPTNVDVPLTPSIKNYVSDADLKNLIYPNWSKINPNRAAWTAEFDRIVKK